MNSRASRTLLGLRLLRHHLSSPTQSVCADMPQDFKEVVRQLQKGQSLKVALQAADLDSQALACLEEAEKNGEVPGALDVLCRSYQLRVKYQGIFERAFIYPLIVLSLLVLVVGFCAYAFGEYWMLAKEFQAPLNSWILGIWLSLHSLSPLILFAGILMLMLILAYGLGFRRPLWIVCEPWLRSLPWYRRFLQNEAASQLLYVMSASSKSSRSMADSLHSLAQSHPSANLRKLCLDLMASLKRGQSIGSVLAVSSSLPDALRMILIVAEEGGDLDSGFEEAMHLLDLEIPELLFAAERYPFLLFLGIAGVCTGTSLALIFFPLGRMF